MSDIDYSAPEHRLDNMSNMRFVRAYARVRWHILNPANDESRVPFLEGYVREMDRELAQELMLPENTMVQRLEDIGDGYCNAKDGQDQAGPPTA